VHNSVIVCVTGASAVQVCCKLLTSSCSWQSRRHPF